MDKAMTVALSAAVGAVVAVATTEVVKRLNEKKENPDNIMTIPEALQNAYNRGWWAGRDEMLAQYDPQVQTAEPSNLT
jgi:hypothetical protein